MPRDLQTPFRMSTLCVKWRLSHARLFFKSISFLCLCSGMKKCSQQVICPLPGYFCSLTSPALSVFQLHLHLCKPVAQSSTGMAFFIRDPYLLAYCRSCVAYLSFSFFIVANFHLWANLVASQGLSYFQRLFSNGAVGKAWHTLLCLEESTANSVDPVLHAVVCHLKTRG